MRIVIPILLLLFSGCGLLDRLVYEQGEVWSITSRNGEVYVSVWDDECEDGDIIQVSLGSFSTTVELTNQPKTYTVRLEPGTYTLRTLAINGSGNKGPCDYRNANTYAIKVWGNGERQPNTFYTFTTEAAKGFDHSVILTVP